MMPLPWDEPDPELLDNLTRHGAMAADTEVIGFAGTGAQRTRLAVQAALRTLLANGLVTAVPLAEWPEYVTMDPPKGA